MRIEIDEMVQAIRDELQMIAEHPDGIDARIDALTEAVEAAEEALVKLRERHVAVAARRQDDGLIALTVFGTPLPSLDESAATTLRDQLDVALHVPPPAPPTPSYMADSDRDGAAKAYLTNPPSRL